MKNILFLALALGMFACAEGNKTAENVEDTSAYEYYGDTITTAGALPAAELPKLMEGKETMNVKLVGKIEECCQKKGCWMKVDIGGGQTVRVSFKDYGFFVPMNSAGKEVVMEGIATMDVTSVESLRHFAEDAGKSKEEIAAITEPKKELVFEASGVILR
jgi:hypothetical protein